MMKRGSVFLNLSRGFVVNHEALAENLKSGRLSGAAVNVFPEEPRGAEPFSDSLQNLPNVILTPHIGGSTEEAQQSIGQFVSAQMCRYLQSGNTRLSVNFPQCQLDSAPQNHRLVHIHRNIPGMLLAINRVFAERGINVERQVYDTKGTDRVCHPRHQSSVGRRPDCRAASHTQHHPIQGALLAGLKCDRRGAVSEMAERPDGAERWCNSAAAPRDCPGFPKAELVVVSKRRNPRAGFTGAAENHETRCLVHVVSRNPSLQVVAVGGGALAAAGARARSVKRGNVAVGSAQETVIHIIRVGVGPVPPQAH